MNFQEPYRIHQIDFDNIVYTKIKSSESKKIIFMKYKEKNKEKPFVIQCPTLLNINKPLKINDEYHELEIPIITQEKNKSSNLVDFFEDLDRKVVQDAKSNSKIWFNEVKNKDLIRYKKIIKESDYYKDGILRIKIIKNFDFETLLQIADKKRITIKEIPNNSWCKMLLEIYAVVINFQNNNFYVFLRPIILSFKEKQIVNYNYKLFEDSDEELDIPDTELNGLFLKSVGRNKNDNITSSQIKLVDKKFSETSTSESSTSTSPENLSSEKEEEQTNTIDRLSSSESEGENNSIREINNIAGGNSITEEEINNALKKFQETLPSEENNKNEDEINYIKEEINNSEINNYENPIFINKSEEINDEDLNYDNIVKKISESSTSSEKIRLTDSTLSLSESLE